VRGDALPFLAELTGPDAQALRTRATVVAREAGHGHILARHHPDLSDLQLQERLSTGLDPQGEPAPTAGISSKFTTEDVFATTLTGSLNEIHQRLRQTRRALSQLVTAYAQAEADFAVIHDRHHQEGGLGHAVGNAQMLRAQARDAMHQGIQQSRMQADRLPVFWHPARERIELYEKYVIMKNHGQQVGSGYEGLNPVPGTQVRGKPPKGLGQQRTMTIYQNTQAFAGPARFTLTVVWVAGGIDRAMARRHAVNGWHLRTHYPCQPANGLESLTGDGED